MTEKAGDPIPVVADTSAADPALDLPLELLTPEGVIEASDPELFAALLQVARETPSGPNPFSVFLGLVPGQVARAQFTLQFDIARPEVVELLAVDGVEADPAGIYSAVSMLFINRQPTCSIFRFPSISLDTIEEHKGASPTGGCCAVLAVAHSLVRKMGGIVTTDDATVDTDDDGKPDKWDPDFLGKVRRASGDDDDDRGLTDGEVEDAHTADWNESWDVDQVDDNVELFDDDDLTCEELRTRCGRLIGRLGTNDDITMRIFGRDGKKGDEWGHRVPVESASFTEGPPCCCEITITKTSRQEPGGATDFDDIPFDPGTATYSICTDAAGNTTVSNTEFPTSTILTLQFDSFDEDPTSDDVEPTDQGAPGSALTD